jgi:hypothetical protein
MTDETTQFDRSTMTRHGVDRSIEAGILGGYNAVAEFRGIDWEPIRAQCLIERCTFRSYRLRKRSPA